MYLLNHRQVNRRRRDEIRIPLWTTSLRAIGDLAMSGVPAVPTRADLVSLPPYVPGRTVPGTIKLASNEVPGGSLPSVAKAIAEAATAVNRYPDIAAQGLTERLARDLNFPATQIAIGCG